MPYELHFINRFVVSNGHHQQIEAAYAENLDAISDETFLDAYTEAAFLFSERRGFISSKIYYRQ